MKKTAIVTGVTGQDGAYLSKFLIEKGYEVVGLTRGYSSHRTYNLTYLGIADNIRTEVCDLNDFSQIFRIIIKYKPIEIYNLSAQSSVGLSFEQPIGTIKYNITSTLNLLEAIRLIDPDIKMYQASTSEAFGQANKLPITIQTQLDPVSPYGVSKASSHMMLKNYREAYSLHVCSGFTFNHESFLRPRGFFVKKVITTAIGIQQGKVDNLTLGNISVKRDFGYAPEYVKAMWLMLQNSTPKDYIIASGKSILLKDIVHHVFDYLNLSKNQIVINDELFRPDEIYDIYGDSGPIRNDLGWKYDLDFREVVDMIIEEELSAS